MTVVQPARSENGSDAQLQKIWELASGRPDLSGGSYSDVMLQIATPVISKKN
jgi:hypothetical protein